MEKPLRQKCALKCVLRRQLTWFWNSINMSNCLIHTYTLTPTHTLIHFNPT